jgi:hypothetical protein
MRLSENRQDMPVESCVPAPGSLAHALELPFGSDGEWRRPLDGSAMRWSDGVPPICPTCERTLHLKVINPLVGLRPPAT